MKSFEHTVVVSPYAGKWKICYWDKSGKIKSTALSLSAKMTETAQKVRNLHSGDTKPEMVIVSSRGELWDFEWLTKYGYARMLSEQDNRYHRIEEELHTTLLELREKSPLSGRTLSKSEEKVIHLAIKVVLSEITLRKAYRQGHLS